MINEALEGLRDISRKCGCTHIMDNIDITMDVMRKSSEEDEKSISALALSFFADYAIDRRNIELLHNIHDLSERLGLIDEFQSRKAYEIIYILREETLNVYPESFRELISFMEGLEAENLDYRIVPYDPGNTMIIE